MPDLFSRFTAAADAAPDSLALAGAHVRLTAAALCADAAGIGLTLRELGVRPGDVVGVDLPDALDAVVTLALLHEGVAGGRLAGRPTDGPDPFNWLLTARPGAAGDRTIVVDPAWLAAAAARGGTPDPRTVADDALCRVIHSSGTTGVPHAVPFTAAQLTTRVEAAARDWIPAWPFVNLIGTGAASGQMSLLAALAGGRTAYLPGTPEQNLGIITESGAAAIKGSPVQLDALVRAWSADPRPLPALRVVASAGHHLPARLAERMRRAWGVRILSLYGSTEAGTVARLDVTPADAASGIPEDMVALVDAGEVIPGMDLDVVDDDDAPVPPGTVGHLRYRRPDQPDHYLDDPDASARVFRGGWFHPGDLAALTADGRVLLAGREAELINASGVKVDPGMLDRWARADDDVVDAAAFGVRTGAGLTQVGLAVVLAPGADPGVVVPRITAAAGAARPALVVRVAEIPRNAMGKPLRDRLAARYAGRVR